MPVKTVKDLLAEIRERNPDHHALVESVRKLVKKSIPSVTEEVKYGGIVFSSGVPFGGVFDYKDELPPTACSPAPILPPMSLRPNTKSSFMPGSP